MNTSRKTEHFETLEANTYYSTAVVETNDTKNPNNVAGSFNASFLTITGKLNTHEILKVDAFSFAINSAYPNTIKGRLPVMGSEPKKRRVFISLNS
jgi:hypothetical protein